MGTNKNFDKGYMTIAQRFYTAKNSPVKNYKKLNDAQYELACYCKEHDIKQRRKYTYYYTMTHKTDGLTPEGFCVLYRQKNKDAQTTDEVKIANWEVLNPIKVKTGHHPNPDTLNEDGTKKPFEEWRDEIIKNFIDEHASKVAKGLIAGANESTPTTPVPHRPFAEMVGLDDEDESIERHLNKVETHKETLGDALNKKIKDDTVYKIYIKGDDLKRLTDILQTPATKSQYRVEVIDNRIKIDSIPQKAQNDISDVLRNLGVDEGTLQNLMPQIRRLSAEASKHARVLSDRDVKETSQND